MNLQQQADILDKTYRMLTDFCGKPPRGTVAPWWETSKEAAELLLKYGVEYGMLLSSPNQHAEWLSGYKEKAETWMKPLEKGSMTGLVEIPANWYLDDLPPMMFIKKAPNSHGWVDPKTVEALWRDHFDYFHREYDDFVFPVTIHPDASGHPHVLLMLERVIEYISKQEGVQWVTMEQICDDFKSKHPAPEGALMPAGQGAILKNPAVELGRA
ncbi:MAG: hypothetical protein M1817_006663 [Caeruleum heppii]|nr:MAG: hypothetical protein M1817_006663 [Caeruleum heppii]